MKKSLGNKRNEIGDGKEGKADQISDLTRLYAGFRDSETRIFVENGKSKERVVSKVFANHAFGYLRLTIERPLRVNLQASPERIDRLAEETAFKALAESRKTKDKKAAEAEMAAGKREQDTIRSILGKLDPTRLWMDRAAFAAELDAACRRAGYPHKAPIRKAILSALSERDPAAEICRDVRGEPEPDPELRDTEIVSLPDWTELPLPMGYGKDAANAELVAMFRDHCEAYFNREVRPHWPDAWIDWSKTKLGYEIPLTRHFYVYEPPRELAEIEEDIRRLEKDIIGMLKTISA
jgi:type I restriction enzyme M protein